LPGFSKRRQWWASPPQGRTNFAWTFGSQCDKTAQINFILLPTLVEKCSFMTIFSWRGWILS
jgi:hypothetical protein